MCVCVYVCTYNCTLITFLGLVEDTQGDGNCASIHKVIPIVFGRCCLKGKGVACCLFTARLMGLAKLAAYFLQPNCLQIDARTKWPDHFRVGKVSLANLHQYIKRQRLRQG